ncbi:sulfotransferase family protein [Bacillus altitudinis]|uniref:glycosyl transferase group 1 n=1 Tax=Bacillus altitudinis TaxID=293387 RepID=UPI00039EB0B3
MDSKLFLVLCNHRSGSSAVAGVLHHLGIHMGEQLIGPSSSNLKGHFENINFVIMNDKILESLNSFWFAPPSRTSVLSNQFPKDQIRSFLSNQVKPVWGVKDPRTALTFDIWKPFFEEISDITFIFVWRPIEQSVSSLALREGFGERTADFILKIYEDNLKRIRKELEQKEKDIIDINFSDLLGNPEPFVKEINFRLNKKEDQNIENVRGFLDGKLKHF